MDVNHRRYQEPKLVLLIGNRHNVRDSFRPPRPQFPVPARRSEAPMGMQEFEWQDADFTIPSPTVARQVKDILLVDPDTDSLRAAQKALRFVADVEVSSTFAAARARMVSNPPDLLVTNLRLQAYNGLHLVHMAPACTRCIVYSNHDDLLLAREVQAAGAFYERSRRLPRTLAAYVYALLPPHDRRNLTVLDRRDRFRGGRRSADR